MTDTVTTTAPTTVPDAAKAANESVLAGVTAPAKAAPSKPAPRKPAAKGSAKAPAAKPAKAVPSGARIWASKDVTPAMAGFTKWIARTYPELKVDAKPGSRDARLVMIASKAYRYFQSSDLNR